MRGLETGWFQRKIAESAARQQWEIEQHRRVIVGVNEFVTDEAGARDPDSSRSREATEREQRAAHGEDARDARQRARATKRSTRLREAAATARRTSCPYILDCARAYCTLYEIRAAMETVFGAYREPVFF